MEQLGLFVAAAGFAVVCGLNDGASLVAIGLRGPFVRALRAVCVVAALVVIAPLVVGTAVARTLTEHLVDFSGDQHARPVLVALLATALVVGTLARRGLPTSITLALVGSIVGSGVGHGLPTDWGTTARVLTIAIVAPFIGALAGFSIGRLSDAIRPRVQRSTRVAVTHLTGFGSLAFAYGANAGQSMIAVWIFATAATGSSTDSSAQIGLLPLIILGLLFGIGTALGLPRLGAPFGSGLILVRPAQAANAEISAAAAVLGSTAAGSPVSIIQVLTAALIGTGMKDGHHLVRWRRAAKTALAWYATFPAAMGLAMCMAWASSLSS